jgi:hypothetical protein
VRYEQRHVCMGLWELARHSAGCGWQVLFHGLLSSLGTILTGGCRAAQCTVSLPYFNNSSLGNPLMGKRLTEDFTCRGRLV